jgi:raffinose/stachyose/melibiose transport system substrate-binding protein
MTEEKHMRRRRLYVAAAGLAGLLIVIGCAPGSGSAGNADETPDTGGEVNTDPASMGDLTLTVWDQEVRGGQAAQIEALNAAFQEEYPNITLERVSRSFEDLQATLRLAITDDEPPDVVQANNGRADMGAFVAAGLLANLDQYRDAYGWADRYPESVLSYSSYTEDGVTFGEGSLWGLPQMGEVVGFYYNKTLLDQLGLEVPVTWDDLDAALAAAKDAGQLPLQFGNLEAWPGIHLLGAVQSRYTPADQIRNLGFGRPGAQWTTEENRQAAQTLVDWVDAGYVTPDFNGITPDDAWQAFAQGEGVFMLGGTWLIAELMNQMGDDVGFTVLLGAGSDVPVGTGGTSLPFAVTDATENSDAAAAYIDFITSSDAMKVVTEEGNLPIIEASQQQLSAPLQEEAFAAWDAVTGSDGLLPYLDYATPGSYDLLTAQVQALMAGETEPSEFLDLLQAEYESFVGG